MADYLADVGRRLRDARLRNRPDLDSIPKASRELQDKYGVGNSEKQYGRWERGESEPRGAKREALARMLQVRPEDIWGEAPIAPEDELRAQLQRIETNQRKIVADIAAMRDERAAAEARLATQLRSIARKLGTEPKGSRTRSTG